MQQDAGGGGGGAAAAFNNQTVPNAAPVRFSFKSKEQEILQSVGLGQKYNLISIFYPSDFDFKLINPQALLKNNFCLISLLCSLFIVYTCAANRSATG